MIKHHSLCHTQNLENYDIAKKESIFIRPYLLKDKANQLLNYAHRCTTNPSSLVYISKIKKNMIIDNTQWYRLNKISRLFYIFAYAEEQGFYAISIIFSYELMNKITNNDKPADFIRRRINENFKLKFDYIPLYSFILEESQEQNIHLHGVMEIKNLEKTKQVLKRTCFGKNYENETINKYICQATKLKTSGRWLGYCLKGKYAKNKQLLSYTSQELTTQTREQYNLMKETHNNG